MCNAGILGDTAQAALARLNRDVLAFHPKTVLVAFGTNDSGMLTKPVPLNEFRADLEAIAGTVTSHGAKVVFLSLPPVNVPLVESHLLNPSRHTEYNDAIRSVANEPHVPLVDLTAAFGGDLNLLHDGVHHRRGLPGNCTRRRKCSLPGRVDGRELPLSRMVGRGRSGARARHVSVHRSHTRSRVAAAARTIGISSRPYSIASGSGSKPRMRNVVTPAS